ncbi:MAG TPA: hypothetical protein VNM90_03210, partial [Haliangium sp.]|nr:hypothetical protein [Haliangium sp.]
PLPGMPLPGVPGHSDAATIIAPLDRNALAQVQAQARAGMSGSYNSPGLPGVPPGQQGPGGMPQDDLSGPPQTILLPDSQAMMSFRPPGPPPGTGPAPAVGPAPGSRPVARYDSAPMPGQAQQGSDTLFWIICIVSGMVVGVLAYVLALQIW